MAMGGGEYRMDCSGREGTVATPLLREMRRESPPGSDLGFIFPTQSFFLISLKILICM